MKGTATVAGEGTPVSLRTLQVPPVDHVKPFLPAGALPAPEVVAGVARILQQVRDEGDAGVRTLTARFDGVDLSPETWELPREAWDAALTRIPTPLREALERAVLRVEAYHRHQVESGFMLREEDGTLLGMRVQPLDRVGLYVPGGKASYPSSVIMNAVPARVAGVGEIIAVVPPAGVTDAVLAACALSGVTRVFRIGGAQAVAALAFGTETVPRTSGWRRPSARWWESWE
jgi:histidinol dehydrogenase